MKTYRVGEFANITGVSAKTLRYYDAVGLLRPAKRDSRSGYRLYTAQQLGELSYILNLRHFGLSIEEISQMRPGRDSLSPRLLDLLRSKVEAEAARAQAAISFLEAIDAQQNTSLLQVVTAIQQPQCIASIRASLGSYRDAIDLETELLRSIPSGVPTLNKGVLWHSCADAGSLEAEAFIAFSRPRRLQSNIDVRTLPALPTAAVYCPNNDERAELAYDTLRTWMKIRGYTLAGPKVEIELGDTLQIQFPFASA